MYQEVSTTKGNGDEQEETEQKTTHTKLDILQKTGSFKFG